MSGERHAPLIYVTVSDPHGNRQRVTDQTHLVKSLEYSDLQNKVDKCVLTVDNFDLRNFDDPLWVHGNYVQVSWGYPGAMAITREVIITKVTGFEELKVEGKAKSILIDAHKRSRTFRNMRPSEVVKQIAAEYGYLPETLLIEETGKKQAHITQAGLSDAQFIRKLAHQAGFDFYVDFEGFHFHEANHGQDPCRLFTWYTDRRGDVMKISVESDITRKPAAVKKTGRDPLDKTNQSAGASNKTDPERKGTGRIGIVASADLMSAAFESRDNSPPPELLYTPSDAGLLMSVDPSLEAKKKFRAATRSTVKMTLDAIGDPSMLAKTVVQLEGVGKKLSGLYFVREVKHKVQAGEYTMQIKLASDGVNEVRTLKNNGLPDIGNASTAKRSYAHLKDVNAASILLRRTASPDALVPVPLYDKQGHVVGTTWRERKPGEVDPKPPGPPRTIIDKETGAIRVEEG